MSAVGTRSPHPIAAPVAGNRTALLVALAGATLASGCYLRHERTVECDAGAICNACVQGSCNHDTGQGCAEGEGCFVVAADPLTGALTTGCRATRSRPLGGACTTNSDCESGLGCLLGPGLAPPAFCVPNCCGGSGCPPGMECGATRVVVGPDAGVGALVPVVGICTWPLHDCDVVQQTGCPGGQGCYLTPTPSCLPQGTRGAGAACVGVAECAPGHSCIAQEDGAAFCRRYCMDDGDCGGRRCEIAASMLTVRGVGLCR